MLGNLSGDAQAARCRYSHGSTDDSRHSASNLSGDAQERHPAFGFFFARGCALSYAALMFAVLTCV